jgi:ribosomal protein S16
LEKIGSYRPIIDKWSNKYLILNVDRLQFWLKRGAKMNNVTFFLAKPLIEVRQNIRKK